MLKIFNALSVCAVIGSASWAYSMKYETIFHVERVKKLEAEERAIRDTLAVQRAEWQLLNAPARLQALSDRHLALKPLAGRQIVRAIEVPEKPKAGESSADRLDELITGSIATPDAARRTTGRTPGR